MPAERRVRAGEIEIAIREWNGAGSDFVLVHGLASNAKTWELVGGQLSAAGHHVVHPRLPACVRNAVTPRRSSGTKSSAR